MQPETREVLRCLYAPRAPLPGEAPDTQPAVAIQKQAILKQAILSTAFDDPKSVASVVAAIAGKAEQGKMLSVAAFALHGSDPVKATEVLADISLDAVLDFARAASAARIDLESATKNGAQNLISTSTERQVAEREHGSRSALIDALERSARVDPVGFLHLERLQFTPVSYRQGELVYSVTLMPGEIVRLTHQEWSRTEREFTSLVAETLETEQEDAVSEKSELTESTAAQEAHSMAFSASLSASGSVGVFSFAANAGLQLSQQTSSTRETSRKQSREMTRRAASRAKKEHKITFRTMSAEESQDTSFREISNTSPDPVRWDFHRIAREWNVKLYRYGLRLTYDITIPEPGSYLMRLYREIEDLDRRIATPPRMPAVYEITPENYTSLQTTYGVLLEPPPSTRPVQASTTTPYPGTNDMEVAGSIELPIPEGFELDPTSVEPDEPVEAWKGWRDAGGGVGMPTNRTSRTDMRVTDNRRRLSGGPVSGVFSWHFTVYWWDFPVQGARAVAGIRGIARPSASSIGAWRSRVYAALVEALRTRNEERVAALSRQRETLVQRLAASDTLTLRSLEREEIMKGVLRWLLGPSFRFSAGVSPSAEGATGGSSDLDDPRVDEASRGYYDPNTGAVVDARLWQSTLRFGQLINFLHQAIEWENVNFVLYPYFWSDHTRWDSKQRFLHGDDTHRQFLRAGAARVVLTIREGFEAAWLSFADTGQLALTDPHATAPYLSIADEIRHAAQTYQSHTDGVQPLDEPGLLIGEWSEYTPTGAMDVVRGPELHP